MKNLKYYFKKARKEKFAIGQFNFSTLSQMRAIVAAAEKLKAPVILGTSEGEGRFFGLEEATALRNVLREKTGLPIFLNLDHGKSFENSKKAIDAGYDMVHFDGSKLTLQENIKITKEVKKYANWRGIFVEGEIGVLGTDASKLYSEKLEIKEENLTKPVEALKYFREAKPDLLAVSIGNFHGMAACGGDPNLRIDLLDEINKIFKGKILLVLHGGSGTPAGDIKKAINLGIVKININTELRIAFTKALTEALSENQNEATPYKYLPQVESAVQAVVEEKIRLFGSEGKA